MLSLCFIGYGLGMMVDLMCGVMSDSQYAYKVRRWTTSDRKDSDQI